MGKELTRPEAKKHLMKNAKECPYHTITPILEALKRGRTERQAAAAAGFSLAEFRYALKLGEEGHPAWMEFRTLALKAWGKGGDDVWDGVTQRAIDGRPADVDRFMKARDPDFREEERAAGSPAQIGGVQVLIQEKFDPIPEPPILEAETVEEA